MLVLVCRLFKLCTLFLGFTAGHKVADVPFIGLVLDMHQQANFFQHFLQQFRRNLISPGDFREQTVNFFSDRVFDLGSPR